MRRVLPLMFVLLLLPGAREAAALSCAQVPFDEDAIYHAAVIFEGKVLEELEQKESFIGTIFGGDEESALRGMTPYLLEVTRAWKGTSAGSNISVWMNTAWGDRFDVGKSYLVVAIEQDEEYVSPACGFTTSMDYAGKMVEKLNLVLGESPEEQ